MKIVGSTALENHGLSRNQPKDLGIWVKDKNSWLGDPKADVEEMPDEILELLKEGLYASVDDIYTIKCSHLGWSNPNWNKHKLDILWLKNHGANLKNQLFKKLVKYWKIKFNDKSFLSLTKPKKDFFTDHVTYIYDHDYLHELVAYPNRPIYEQVLKGGQEVLVDKGKFFELDFESQVRMFREEITVIACERWLLNPKSKVNSLSKAYLLALEKTITTLTKGWATEFIVLNLEQFYTPDENYFKHILKTLGDNMSEKVNMEIFERYLGLVLAEEPEWNYKLESLVHDMCEGYPPIVPGITYQHLEQSGGGEGGAEACYGVFSLNGKIYRSDYRYYSYSGHDYDGILSDLREVKPVEKTVIVYE